LSRLRDESLEEAGRRASLVASCVVESTALDPSEALLSGAMDRPRQPVFIEPEVAAGMSIYVAGHFHSTPLREWIEKMAAALEAIGFRTRVPHRDIGVVGTRDVTPDGAFRGDVDAV